MQSISREIVEEIRSWVEEIWQLERHWDLQAPDYLSRNVHRAPRGIDLWKATDHVLHSALAESIKRLREKFQPDELEKGATDLYFHPVNWLNIDIQHPHWAPTHYELAIINTLETLLVLYPSTDLIKEIEERIYTVLQHPFTGGEKGKEVATSSRPDNHYPPVIEDCTRVLFNLQPNHETLEYARSFIEGKFNMDVMNDPWSETAKFGKAYEVYSLEIPIIRMMEYIHLHQGLEYELFCRAIISLQFKHVRLFSCLYVLSKTLSERKTGQKSKKYEEGFLEISEIYLNRSAEEYFENLTEENHIYLRSFENLSGSHWLIRAAKIHQDFRLQKLAARRRKDSYETYHHREGIDTLVIHLARTKDILPDNLEEQEVLVEQLRTFPNQTLKYMLPITSEAQPLLLKALGWETAQPLIEFMLELGGRKFEFHRDIPNSSDPNSGAVDLKRYAEVIELAGRDRAREIFVLFDDAGVELTHTISLLRAALGEGREKIEKNLIRRNQRILKAYSLLPLQRGDEEVLERYRFIQEYRKGSKNFGPERQANERGAVQTALVHLAQIGSYADVMRMELAMEAHLSTKVIPLEEHWIIEGVEIVLQLKGADPDLLLSRNGKPLKSIPQPVRRSDQYTEVRTLMDEIRKQAKRFRNFYEDMMILNKAFSREDLELLNKIPIAAFMLSQLILQTSDGELGFYVPSETSIETLDGDKKPVHASAFIVHSYHLQEAGQLGEWQRRIMNRRIVQPFKQAFRELYVITPAELTTGYYSNRFAGFVVDGGKAFRLFQSRHWEFENNVVPFKTYQEFGFQARFTFPDVGHYWSRDHATSDRILFQKHPIETHQYRDRPNDMFIPLDQIPPTIFSEVMRDADLVVSAGLVSDHELPSKEGIQNKVEIVRALLEDLNIQGVTFEGHFACVQGRLAKYRVHLSSAIIHIDPGSYLCIVPDNWGKKHKDVFLPFSDPGDTKISEVISKIFLLLHDDKIKDESIIRQIKERGKGI